MFFWETLMKSCGKMLSSDEETEKGADSFYPMLAFSTASQTMNKNKQIALVASCPTECSWHLERHTSKYCSIGHLKTKIQTLRHNFSSCVVVGNNSPCQITISQDFAHFALRRNILLPVAD
jgi:hypothetical protein